MEILRNSKPVAPFQHKLLILKHSLKSFLIPYKKKRKVLDHITLECRKIAIKRGLNFAIFTQIFTGHGSEYQTIACLDDNSYSHRIVNIIVFEHLVMVPVYELKITIFHEYCHFLLKVCPDNMIWTITNFYAQNDIPHIYGDPTEDFCEIFAHYILEQDTKNQKLNTFLEIFIKNTQIVYENQNWMFKATELPDYYFNMD